MPLKYLAAIVRLPCAVAGGALLCAWAASAGAATVTVRTADLAGHPLVDAVVLLESTAGKVAVKPLADVQISQAKKQFDPRVTLVTVGTAVTFPNFDTVRHHVYSFSPIKTFELKLYAGVPNAPVVFDKPGVAVLGCNIHDNMAAWVVVVDTPWYSRSAAGGVAKVENVPAGAYRMRVWHAGLPPNADWVTSNVTVGPADIEQAVKLPVAAP